MKAQVYIWTESKTSNPEGFEKIKIEKKKMQEMIRSKLHRKWDFVNADAGTTSDGNVARDLLYDKERRETICNEIDDDDDREIALKYGQDLSFIMQAFSSDHQIDLKTYSKTATSLYLLLVEKLSWTNIVILLVLYFIEVQFIRLVSK